MCFLG